MADIPPYPLYNRTYSLYRASPLHHADAPLLNDRSLRTHAKRLRDQLKGDNIRGVQVDFATSEDTARLGPLESCEWELIGDEDAWIDRHRQLVDPEASQMSTALTSARARGIEVTLEYEKQSYNALLLRDPGVTASPDGFTFLPLLLVKMPGAVREVFLNYLRTAFGAYVAPMRLSSDFITSRLETYIHHLSASTSSQSIQEVIRQLHVQLAFPSVTTSLKHIEITIAGSDVAGFVTRGRQLKDARAKPFTAALSSYLKAHLALDLSNSQVLVSRISCNSFHLGTERLKLAPPDTSADISFSDEGELSQDASAGQMAVDELYKALARDADVGSKLLPTDSQAGRDETPTTRKRAVSNAATTNNNAKKSRAKGKENSNVADDDGMSDA